MRPPDRFNRILIPPRSLNRPANPCRTASPRVAFILPHDILLRLRRTAVVVLTSAAVALSPMRSPARAAAAAAPLRQDAKPAVIFDRHYANRPDAIWESLGMPTASGARNDWSQQPAPSPSGAPTHSSVAERLGVPRNSLKSATKRILLVDEVRILWRLLVALTVGGIIGVERRAAKSFAGVRTFSLVSLGAAIFMSTALVAFPNADPARVAAAISSSVGFLGAGVMSKNSRHSRGLTTASSVWLAAALGIAAASGLFILSYSGAILTVLIARYARFDNSLHLIHPSDIADSLHDDIEVAGSDADLGLLLDPPKSSRSAFGYQANAQNGSAAAFLQTQVEASLQAENEMWDSKAEGEAVVDASNSSSGTDSEEDSSSHYADNGSTSSGRL